MCLTTTCELQCMTVDLAPVALAKSRLERTALYLALLLAIKNQRRTTHSIVSPSGDRSRTLAPLARWLDKPSIHIVHAIGFPTSFSIVVNLAMKLAKACALIAVLGMYWTSNSPSLIAYRTSRLAASRLFIIFCSGLFVWTTMVCAWKYGLSFCATMINTKASFYIRGYLPLAP